MRRADLAVLLLPLLSACVISGTSVSPNGRSADVKSRALGSQRGELLASRSDSIWLLRDGVVLAIPMSDVNAVTVERHAFGGKRTVAWSAGIGAVTGVAMSIACASYKPKSRSASSGCAGWLPGTAAVWTGLGSLFAISNAHSADFHLDARDSVRLRAFARFPQGMPTTFIAGARP